MIDHAGRAVFKLAHPLVDHRQQILQPIGHRRVDRVSDALGIDLFDGKPVGRSAILRVGDLGKRDHLGENLGLFLSAGAAGEDDVDDLPKLPARTAAGDAVVEDVCALAEAAPVFTHDHQHAQVGPRAQDLRMSVTASIFRRPSFRAPQNACSAFRHHRCRRRSSCLVEASDLDRF
jgi:hypothetical protein